MLPVSPGKFVLVHKYFFHGETDQIFKYECRSRTVFFFFQYLFLHFQFRMTNNCSLFCSRPSCCVFFRHCSSQQQSFQLLCVFHSCAHSCSIRGQFNHTRHGWHRYLRSLLLIWIRDPVSFWHWIRDKQPGSYFRELRSNFLGQHRSCTCYLILQFKMLIEPGLRVILLFDSLLFRMTHPPVVVIAFVVVVVVVIYQVGIMCVCCWIISIVGAHLL